MKESSKDLIKDDQSLMKGSNKVEVNSESQKINIIESKQNNE